MRKLPLFLNPAFVLLLAAGLILAAPSLSAQEKTVAAKGVKIPKKVSKVLTTSCLPCHSDTGRAKRALNLSNWKGYDPATQANKAKEIGGEVDRGKMPPKMFVENNPDLAPTAKQKALIVKWSKSAGK